MRDIIHQKEDNKWYYWDETWAFEEGPFDSAEEAQAALNDYYGNYLMKSRKRVKKS